MGKITNIERIRRKLLGRLDRIGDYDGAKCVFLGKIWWVRDAKVAIKNELRKSELTRAYVKQWYRDYDSPRTKSIDSLVFYGAGAACMGQTYRGDKTMDLWDKGLCTGAGFMWQRGFYYVGRDLTHDELRQAANIYIKTRTMNYEQQQNFIADWIESIGATCIRNLQAA